MLAVSTGLAAGAPPRAHADTPPAYTVTDLGTLPGASDSLANGINDSGQVVGGSSPIGNGIEHAFRTTATGGINAASDLGTFPGSLYSSATGINASGQVAGWSGPIGGGQHAFRTTATSRIDAASDLSPLTNGQTYAYGINASGQVIGESYINGAVRAFRTTATGGIDAASDLGTLPDGDQSSASGINASGQVVGESSYSYTDGALHAFRTTATGGIDAASDLGTLPGGDQSSASGINASGQVVGESGPIGGDRHAFRTTATGGIDAASDLGTFPGDSTSEANGINASGQVVGTAGTSGGTQHAFLYDDAATPHMRDLNSLIPSGSGVTLTNAKGINDLGQIAANGTINGQTHAFRLTPVGLPVSNDPGNGSLSPSSIKPSGIYYTDPATVYLTVAAAHQATVSVHVFQPYYWPNGTHTSFAQLDPDAVQRVVNGSNVPVTDDSVTLSVDGNGSDQQSENKAYYRDTTFQVTVSAANDAVGVYDSVLHPYTLGTSGATPSTRDPNSAVPVVIYVIGRSGQSASSGFVPSLDGFNFANCCGDGKGGTAGPIANPGFSVTDAMFKQQFGHDPNLFERLPGSTHDLYINSTKGGLCFGMSLASAINYLRLSQSMAGPYALPGYHHPPTSSALANQPLQSPRDTTLAPPVAFYQASQLDDSLQSAQNDAFNRSVPQTLAIVEDYLSRGYPIILAYRNAREDSQGHHVVLAYRYLTNVYDPTLHTRVTLIGVYNNIAGTDNSVYAEFWQDRGTWHNKLFGMPGGVWTDGQVAAIDPQLAAGRSSLIPAPQGGAHLSYAGIQSISIANVEGRVDTIDARGYLSGDLSSVNPMIYDNATFLPSTGILDISHPSVYSLTATATMTGSQAMDFAGDSASLQVAETDAVVSPTLNLSIDGPMQTLLYHLPAAPVPAVQARLYSMADAASPDVPEGPQPHFSATFARAIADGGRQLILDGLGVDTHTHMLLTSPYLEDVTAGAGVLSSTVSLGLRQDDGHGNTSTRVVSNLSIPSGVTETIEAAWGDPTGAITVSTIDVSGAVTRTQTSPDAALQVGDGSPVAPGSTVAVTASDTTFTPRELLSVKSPSLGIQGEGQATTTGAAVMELTVPATVTSGTFIVSVVGHNSGVRASGVLSVDISPLQRSALSPSTTPQLFLEPDSFPAGTTVTVSSTIGFQPDEPVSLTIDGNFVGSINATHDGSLDGHITVPNNVLGDTAVVAIGELSGLEVFAPFTVVSTAPPPPTASTPELSSGELLVLGCLPITIALLSRRRGRGRRL